MKATAASSTFYFINSIVTLWDDQLLRNNKLSELKYI